MYRKQFFKAFKLANSLKKQLDEYKKMGKVVQYLAGKKLNAEMIKDELSDDIKLIIDDLKEHLEVKESEEMSIIKDNFQKVIKIVDKAHTQELEEILENLVSAKFSKQNALKDFTDKIMTTIEEIEEEKDFDV
jgi:type I site-specific restriction-modification system R (restriction) subunit